MALKKYLNRLFLILFNFIFPISLFAAPAQIPQPELKYLTGPGNWNVSATKFVVSGNFNGDPLTEVAALYDYGNNNMGIWVFESFLPAPPPLDKTELSRGISGGDITASKAYSSGAGNWSLANTKFVTTADYNGDGYDDIAVMYDYGNYRMGIWIFFSNGTTFTPTQVFSSKSWSVSSTKFLLSGAVTGSGSNDIFAVYNYGNNDMGIWVFDTPGGATLEKTATRELPYTLLPILIYKSGPGNWNVSATKFASSGDYDNDTSDELTLIYDYGSNTMGIWSFNYNPPPPQLTRDFRELSNIRGLNLISPVLLYHSGAGNWNVNATKFVQTGDFDLDGIEDLALMYNYGNNTMGLWFYESALTSLTPKVWFTSGAGGWNLSTTKFMTAGLWSIDPVPDIQVIYDYGNNNMGIWNFSYTVPIN